MDGNSLPDTHGVTSEVAGLARAATCADGHEMVQPQLSPVCLSRAPAPAWSSAGSRGWVLAGVAAGNKLWEHP